MSPHRVVRAFRRRGKPVRSGSDVAAGLWVGAAAVLPGTAHCQRGVDGAAPSPFDQPCGASPGALARAGSLVTAGDAAAVLGQPPAHRPPRPGRHRPRARGGRDPRRRSGGDAATRPVRRRPRPQRGRHLLGAERTAADGLHGDRGRPRDPAGPRLRGRGGGRHGPRGRGARPGPAASSAHGGQPALPDARRAPPDARRPASRHRHRRGAARGRRNGAAAFVCRPRELRVGYLAPGWETARDRVRSAGDRRGAGDAGRHPASAYSTQGSPPLPKS